MPPLLSDQDLRVMRESAPQACHVCRQLLSKNYCRECDEFFRVGHTPDCTELVGERSDGSHHGHRTY